LRDAIFTDVVLAWRQVEAAAPALIVGRSQNVSTRGKIENFTPPQPASAAERDVHTTSGFPLQVKIQITQATGVFDSAALNACQ
jgi:hypothetical protein